MEADLKNRMNVDRDRFMLQVVTGNVKEAPFSEEALAGVRRILGEFFDVPEQEQVVEEGQCMRLGFISGILRALSDPDHEYIKELAGGVPLGLDGAMPRAPVVFEKKTRWAVDPDGVDDDTRRDNYKSTAGHEETIEKLFREEAALGWMEEMSLEEAEARFGGDSLHRLLGCC